MQEISNNRAMQHIAKLTSIIQSDHEESEQIINELKDENKQCMSLIKKQRESLIAASKKEEVQMKMKADSDETICVMYGFNVALIVVAVLVCVWGLI